MGSRYALRELVRRVEALETEMEPVDVILVPLVAVTRRRFAAWNARDVETFLNFCADEPWSVFIGSDPDEWWSAISVW